MKRIERINLMDQVARQLQSRMTFEDIENYLRAFEITVGAREDGWGSKWLYAKHLLKDAPDSVLLTLADELDLAHGYVAADPALADSSYWLEGCFRLFLSHVSVVKVSAATLRDTLRTYGISAFVAHTDIEPTAQWRDEIEKSLFSMHALAAIVSPEFRASAWCDQEVGVAFGRGVLIVPVMRGAEPHGFVGKFQGIAGQGKTVGEVAESIFSVLATHPQTKLAMANALAHQFLFAVDDAAARHYLQLLRRVAKPLEAVLNKLRENVRSREILMRSPSVMKELNKLLGEHGLPAVEPAATTAVAEDDVPF
jgi:hypothetical protein